MLYRLQRYDLYPCEMAELEFTIVAVHRQSFAAAVDRLLDLGMELAQIRFAYNPKARYANVVLLPNDTTVLIEWVAPTGTSTPTFGRDVEDLGAIVQRVTANRE